MDNYNKKRLITLALAGTLIVGITGGIYNYSLKAKKPNQEMDEHGFSNNTVVKKENIINNEQKEEIKENKSDETKPLTNQEVKQIANQEVPVVTKNQNSITEEETIAYFKSMESKINEYVNSENFDKLKDKTSALFITTVDFLFYNGQIKGKTFDELNDETKLKILEIAKAIDSKIAEKWPTYKEDIKTTSKNTYTSASEKISSGIKYIDGKLEEKVGTEKYQESKEKVTTTIDNTKEKVIDTYNNVKSSETYEKAKDTVTEKVDSGKTKIKTWYENFKEKHSGE